MAPPTAFSWKPGALLAAWIILLLAGCATDQPTEATKKPSAVIRSYPGGCVPEVTTEYTDSTETIVTTFTTAAITCIPDLTQWGIEMADPMRVDTPQGDAAWRVKSDYPAANMPSPSHVAGLVSQSPPQVMIEFEPRAQSVEFHYSMLSQARTVWNGGLVNSDSLLVQAVSRRPGTTYYTVHARKVLRSNVPSTTPPWTQWDPVRLSADGNVMEWLWFDGSLLIDDLRVTRFPLQCPRAVMRGGQVTCKVTLPHMSVTGWEFQPDSSNLATVHDASTSKEWTGPMVTDGTVVVHVTSASGARSFKAHIRVVSRASFGDSAWDWRAKWAYKDTVMAQPQPPFVNESGKTEIDYARNEAVEDRFAPRIMPDVWEPDPSKRGYTLIQVPPGGPNSGYWYVQSMSLHMHRRGRLNPFITQAATMNLPLDAALVRECKKHLGGGTTINFYRFNLCKGKNVEDFLAGIRAHEGFGRNGGTGHEGLAQAAATLAENDPYKFSEHRVRSTREALDFVIRDNVPWMADRIVAASRDRQYQSDPIGPRGNWGGTIWDWLVNITPNRFLESPNFEI
ncbi:MAG: hypothetical protein AB1941_09735 [Gemmatimonadota bacterium]